MLFLCSGDASTIAAEAVPPAATHSVEPTSTDTLRETETKLHDLQVKYASMQTKMKQVNREKRALIKAQNKHNIALKKIFNDDQLRSLGRNSMRGSKWSANTVKKALQLRFVCGSTGYDQLLQQHFPLSSLRTLRRKMQCVRFQPGVLHEVFGFMKLKVKEWKPQERECCLTLDEMAITASVEFDASTGKLLGDVTMPDHSGQATHALVFMLGGITTRWKQVVGYHYTGNSINGIVLKAVTLDVIRHAADVGLHVVAVTSDMGSANRAMWKSFGIVCGKYSETTNKIQHPCDPSRFLYFIADVPHVIKNVKAALVNGQTFKLPDDVVASNNLSGSEVSKAPVEALARS